MNLSKTNSNKEDSSIRNRIFNYVCEENPDILALQEFSILSKKTSIIDSLKQKLKTPFHRFMKYKEKQTKFMEGIITFSKYPIIDNGMILNSNKEPFALFCDVRFHDKSIRILNIQLESFHLQSVEDTLTKNRNFWGYAMGGYRLLRKGFICHAEEVRLLIQNIKQSPYPIILCGDFNDVPNSNTYFNMANHLNDAFIQSGTGMGITYNGKYPCLRIDYIFSSDEFKSDNFLTGKVDLSDHFPISCFFKLK